MTDLLFQLYVYREVALTVLGVLFVVVLSLALYSSWRAYRATPRPTKSRTRFSH